MSEEVQVPVEWKPTPWQQHMVNTYLSDMCNWVIKHGYEMTPVQVGKLDSLYEHVHANIPITESQ